MGNIFNDSDDITFGQPSSGGVSRPSNTITPRPTPPRSTQSPRTESQARESRPAVRNNAGVRAPIVRAATPPQSTSPRLNLVRLIESMKSSFLPQGEEFVLRTILFSDVHGEDPMMLVRSGESSLLVGTSFSHIENSGVSYPSFPDMRLVYNERDRLAGWVLLSPIKEINSFRLILESLGYPHVYGTRDVIAQIRSNITDTEFLDKCRFFEIFPIGTDDRKIGEYTVKNTSSGLEIISLGKGFTTALYPVDSTALHTASSVVLSKNADNYIIGNTPFVSGEIIEITSNTTHRKHALKFTFDTFYIDHLSIGVAAGYALKDRNELAENGVLTFVLEEDKNTRAILGHIFIDSRGFVHSYEMMSVHKEILKGIRHTYEQTILANPRTERSELVHTLRREITKYCYLLTGRTPVVMPVIMER